MAADTLVVEILAVESLAVPDLGMADMCWVAVVTIPVGSALGLEIEGCMDVGVPLGKIDLKFNMVIGGRQ